MAQIISIVGLVQALIQLPGPLKYLSKVSGQYMHDGPADGLGVGVEPLARVR